MAEEKDNDTSETKGASKDAQSFALRVKSLATLMAAVTALVVAVSGYFKKPAEPAAKATYNELSEGLKDLSDQIGKNHDDILATRNFFDGWMKAQSVYQVAVADTIPPANSSGIPATHSTARPVSKPRLAPPKPPAPPDLGDKPPPWRPKGLEQFKK